MLNPICYRPIVDEIFKMGSGISDEEVRKILNSKASKANKWELKKQLDNVSNTLKVLKNTTNSLIKGKNRLITRVLESESQSKLLTVCAASRRLLNLGMHSVHSSLCGGCSDIRISDKIQVHMHWHFWLVVLSVLL